MHQESELDFFLLQRQLVDENGQAVNENSDDPAEWARADALLESGAAADILHVGRGRMSVISGDERAFLAERLTIDPEPEARYIRAAVTMHPGSRPPAMQDLVAALLPGDTAVLFEVLISWADLEGAREHPADPDGITLVSLPAGHVILCRTAALPVVSTLAGEEPMADSAVGGAHAEH